MCRIRRGALTDRDLRFQGHLNWDDGNAQGRGRKAGKGTCPLLQPHFSSLAALPSSFFHDLNKVTAALSAQTSLPPQTAASRHTQ